MYQRKYLSAKEIDDLMNQSSDEEDETPKQVRNARSVDIVAIPPPVDQLSDNEDIDDTQIQQHGDEFPTEIAGEVEIQCELMDDFVPEEPMEVTYEEVEVPVFDANAPSTSIQANEPPFQFTAPKWNKRNYDFSKVPTDLSFEKAEQLYTAIGALNPVQLFELFFDCEVIQLITESTNKYAHVDCNDPTFITNTDEIRKFIGILMFTGIHTVPFIKGYWSDNPMFGLKVIKDVLPRDRFLRIKRYFHVCIFCSFISIL